MCNLFYNFPYFFALSACYSGLIKLLNSVFSFLLNEDSMRECGESESVVSENVQERG